MSAVARQAFADAGLAACLLAVDPSGLGGINLRAHCGPVRDMWLAMLAAALPVGTPLRRMPLAIADNRLLGGLDLAATLSAGRPVADRGLLAECDGGMVLLAMAERLSAAQVARLTPVLDNGEAMLERDGLTRRNRARLAMVALDEGVEPQEMPPAALRDRFAFWLDLSGIALADCDDAPFSPAQIREARDILGRVTCPEPLMEALCSAAAALGISSMRAALLAVATARAVAALAGRAEVLADDAATSARLVLGPRATQLPAQNPDEAEENPDKAADEPDDAPDRPDTEPADQPSLESDPRPDPPPQPLEDIVLEAAQAAIPAGLLAQLQLAQGAPSRLVGKSGAAQKVGTRGRPIGARRGQPGGGLRLDLVATLRAAAPWQRLRRASGASPDRIAVRSDDFHVTRYRQRTETTTIFAVDASGSSALNRLAEAKGAVELLLADCYIRRDQVAVLAFRGKGCELMLPPTRSLARARRGLAGLAGGGGTPLALAIDAAAALALEIRRRGRTPLIVFLTDGAANISRDGRGGRALAGTEALAAARVIAFNQLTALLIDTSPRPQGPARAIAEAMQARYLPLPYAGAAVVSAAVRASTAMP